jgi:hypothetical protein
MSKSTTVAPASQSGLEELEAQVQALQSDLESSQQALEDALRVQLRQVVWLSKGYQFGYTRSETPYLRTTAQYASFDKETGVRSFGANKFLVAYGECADQLRAIYEQTGNRLIAITAYERPWSPDRVLLTARDHTGAKRQSDWVITSVEVIGPVRPLEDSPLETFPVEPAQQDIPFSAEPSLEVVPF